MRCFPLTAIALAACSVLAASPDPATARFLQESVAWCRQSTVREQFRLRFYATSHNGNRVASYAEGVLVYNPETKRLECAGARQLFNDRKALGEPFNPRQADDLALGLDAASGMATLTLNSWGKAQSSFQLRSQGGVLYGFTSEQVPALWTFSFRQERQVVPR